MINERETRETKLAELFANLKPEVVKSNVESYRKKFNLKAKAFQVLKGKSKELAP